ncbi:putative transcriptional regulator [Archaeoglobus fulgidus DSM 8774]|uniref:Putative transcriptional regulator n=1 Tax=Archaeoglobus fulgidus DSM 8774 TaxID=1344584 RepID=A0A075WIH7_ARCFL|nr:winged helix-turn-helix transcriptional regulator [Archaeoglobus fulgidus]AIG97388.1 putative transcriptional regulator [Archaeoglobus fulgidus DSM 8774]
MRLTNNDLKVLRALKNAKARYTELAEEVRISPAGLTKVLKKLQKEGLVERMQDNSTYPPPVYYRITEKGRRVLKQNEAAELFMNLIEVDEKLADEIIEEFKKRLEELRK